MSAAEWVLFGILFLEFTLRVALEICEARISGGKLDRFAVMRTIPVVNDLFPPEANFLKQNEAEGAFAKAHEKAHEELHHDLVLKFFGFGSLIAGTVLFGFAFATFRFNLIECVLLIHLLFLVAKMAQHTMSFAQEYEADALAAKRAQKGVAKRALLALVASEFPRTPLFAFVYRTHPTAVMRMKRLKIR